MRLSQTGENDAMAGDGHPLRRRPTPCAAAEPARLLALHRQLEITKQSDVASDAVALKGGLPMTRLL